MNMRSKNGFTLAEVITAVGILVMVVCFAGVIFSESIEAYRIAGANAEIMQKLQAITTQLDRDFSQVRRDGLLEIRSEQKTREETTKSTDTSDVQMDRIYYITTGDFQSWFASGTRQNVARVFWGHNSDSLNDTHTPLDKCRLARDVMLLTPEAETVSSDCNKVSFVKFVADQIASESTEDRGDRAILVKSVPANFADPNNIRQIICENVGEFKIEWIDEENYGVCKSDKSLYWLEGGSDDKRTWQNGELPKAIKFTFTLYDSQEILKGGRRFTHIVYLEN